MSKVHIGNQQFFRQFKPDSELPLVNRVFTKEYEQNRRQQGNRKRKTSSFYFPIS